MRATLLAFLAVLAQAAPHYPAAPKRPVSQTYGDTTFIDDYQWLENAIRRSRHGWRRRTA